MKTSSVLWQARVLMGLAVVALLTAAATPVRASDDTLPAVIVAEESATRRLTPSQNLVPFIVNAWEGLHESLPLNVTSFPLNAPATRPEDILGLDGIKTVDRRRGTLAQVVPDVTTDATGIVTGIADVIVFDGDVEVLRQEVLVKGRTRFHHRRVDKFEQDTTPPAAPANLTASPGFGEVFLQWSKNNEVDFSHYSVKRSTTQGGPYTRIAGTVFTNEYRDRSVVPGTTYYYVVAAWDFFNNESLNSDERSAVPFAAARSTVADTDVVDADAEGRGNLRGFLPPEITPDVSSDIRETVLISLRGRHFDQASRQAFSFNFLARNIVRWKVNMGVVQVVSGFDDELEGRVAIRVPRHHVARSTIVADPVPPSQADWLVNGDELKFNIERGTFRSESAVASQSLGLMRGGIFRSRFSWYRPVPGTVPGRAFTTARVGRHFRLHRAGFHTMPREVAITSGIAMTDLISAPLENRALHSTPAATAIFTYKFTAREFLGLPPLPPDDDDEPPIIPAF